MKKNIGIITGSRAEYGLLKPVINKFYNDDYNTTLIVTGSHLSDSFGNTQEEIKKDGYNDYISIPIPLSDDSHLGMGLSTGIAIEKFSELFSNYKPDILILLGDRFEIFAAAVAARMELIPIAHISGGDITEGAVDDSLRHCITKLSQLHFAGCEDSASRIIQMGEQPSTVFNVGELGVENVLNILTMSVKELSDSLDFDILHHDFCIVTMHPVTLEQDSAESQTLELMKAMDENPNLYYIITSANSDANGRKINRLWENEVSKRVNWKLFDSLGMVRYISTVKYAKAVIGNSSSGIFEAPSLGTPTVNIGDRQKGRLFSDSIINCNPICSDINLAIKKAISPDFQLLAHNTFSPYGDGHSSELICRIVNDFLSNNKLSLKKSFYNLSIHEKGEY